MDECRVAVTPPLNSDHESLAAPEVIRASKDLNKNYLDDDRLNTYSNSPQDLLRSLGITGESTVDGAVFRGAEMIYNYERLLRQVRFIKDDRNKSR